MNITLIQILNLVGKLDDSQGEDNASKRFRRALTDNVKEIGPVRDYIEECLRNSGPQFNRALQDLVNYVGCLLEFDVVFGRYQGVQGEIGFDGHWKSPTGFHVVVEVKTTDAFSIDASILVGYVDRLISSGEIPDWDHALGLYVIGRPDPNLRQLENSIIAEKRTAQLRIISVESLLSVAELLSGFDVTHQDILDVLRPGGPRIDPLADLMSRLVAQREAQPSKGPLTTTGTEFGSSNPGGNQQVVQPKYWLTPVKSTDVETAEECVQRLVGSAGIYGLGEKTPGRKGLKPGDWICFYATAKGVVAHAKVATKPERKADSRLQDPDLYPWTFSLDSAELYVDNPLVLDAELRNGLEAFDGRSPGNPWSWFVQATHAVSENDFMVLTRRTTNK
jgi:hypothetical protein